MLLPIRFASINEPAHLRPGKYRVTCSTYVSPSRSECAFQFEYRLVGAPTVTGIDMIFVGRDGAIRAADFLRMPDRRWRDNFGARSEELAVLLPTEVLDFQLVRVDDCGVQIIAEAA